MKHVIRYGRNYRAEKALNKKMPCFPANSERMGESGQAKAIRVKKLQRVVNQATMVQVDHWFGLRESSTGKILRHSPMSWDKANKLNKANRELNTGVIWTPCQP